MIHFKNHKAGFSILEVMFALALLMISGTSLFMMQATIFNKVFHAHNKVVAQLYLKKLKDKLHLKIFQLQQQKEPLANIAFQEQVKQPIMNTNIKLQSIPQNSSLFKKFSEHVQIINQTATFDSKKDSYISFVFTPAIEKDANEETK